MNNNKKITSTVAIILFMVMFGYIFYMPISDEVTYIIQAMKVNTKDCSGIINQFFNKFDNTTGNFNCGTVSISGANGGTYNQTLANNVLINNGGQKLNFINGTNSPIVITNSNGSNKVNITISSSISGLANPYKGNVTEYSFIIQKSGSTINEINGTSGLIITSNTNATTVIQDAINRLSGCIFIKSGTYIVLNIQLKNNTCIIGEGSGKTILQGRSGGTIGDHGYVISNRDTATISVPTSNVLIANLEVDGTNMNRASYSTFSKGIDGQFYAKSLFYNLYVHDTPATCIGIDDLYGVLVYGNIVNKCGTSGQTFGSNGYGIGIGQPSNPQPIGEWWVVSNNISSNVTNSGYDAEALGGSAIPSSTRSYIFSNNISIQDKNGFTDNGANDLVITNNFAFKNSNVGILINTFNSETVFKVVVSNNEVAAPTNDCVLIDDNSQMSIVNNNQLRSCGGNGVLFHGKYFTASGNIISNSNKHGINIFADLSTPISGISITGNTIFNNGKTVSGSNGISLNAVRSTISGVTITGNRIFDDQGSPTQEFGIKTNGTNSISNVIISDNNVQGNKLGGISDSGSSETALIISNNLGARVGTSVLLISQDETNSTQTVTSTPTIIKSYSLATNDYARIIVEAEIEISTVVTSTAQTLNIVITDGSTDKQNYIARNLSSIGRELFTAKVSFVENTAQTISIKEYASATDANTSVIVHSLRIYAVN